jgi:hypothetical protein
MAKQNFSLKELFDLQEEIKTILSEKLTILTRYKLSDIKKTIDSLVQTGNETKDELIKQFGDTGEDGQITLKVFEDEETKKVNPKFQEFIKEWNQVLETEKELIYTPIKLDMIENIQTDKPIEVIFKLLEGAHKKSEE